MRADAAPTHADRRGLEERREQNGWTSQPGFPPPLGDNPGRRYAAASLCSGVGGLDLAVQAALGAESAWFCEVDPHCRTVLERHWPGVDVLPDVREIDAAHGPVDVLHAGYPCQPFSQAGKRLGEADPRHLWPAIERAVRVLGPSVVVLENVSAHLRLGFDTVLSDLARLGFAARWGVVRAADVGAPHRRARLFVVAYATEPRGIEPTNKANAGDAARRGGPGLAWCGGAAADARGERHDRRGGRDEGGAAGARDGRASPEGHRPPVADPHDRTDDRERTCTEPGRGGSPPTDSDSEGCRREPWASQGRDTVRADLRCDADRRARDVQWGVYESAIRRWEHTLGRPAPRPTDDRGRLMPAFVEWMMGFPAGWVDGQKRTHALRMLGNAVVPQQGELAVRLLAKLESLRIASNA